jgi:hypothetical protein
MADSLKRNGRRLGRSTHLQATASGEKRNRPAERVMKRFLEKLAAEIKLT